jgi:hypothetical protein
MERRLLGEAVRLLEKANAGLTPRLCTEADAEALLQWYARVERLAAYGKAVLSARIGDPTALSKASGTSIGKARQTIETARRVAAEPRLAEAARSAEVSLDQADEIARTAEVAPAAVDDLLTVARRDSFRTLRDRARNIRLDAEAGTGLAERQHRARRLRHHVNDLGMVHIEADLEPHVGAPIVERLEAEARRRARSVGRGGGDEAEPFDRYLADALPAVVAGEAKGTGRAEVVVLVGHEVVTRGWRDVRPGEHCKIPGVGPIPPEAAQAIARDAFLSGVFFDGTDLRHFERWTRNIPTAVRLALQLGEPPQFDGPRCVDCGNHFRLEVDHLDPHAAGGPASVENTDLRCPPCHARKSAADRRAGRDRRRSPPPEAPP